MVTIGWISNLLGTCIAMLIVAVLLKRSKHLSDITGLDKVIPLVLIAITLVLESVFTLSVVSARFGIVIGNGIALIFEMTPSLAQVATDPLAVLGICLLAFLLIPITKREQSIIDLTSAPVKPSEIDEICNEVASEFVLSEREAEILKLIAKGNTANGIANKLFISPNTVNTHIRHIYDKVGIHKRSEFLEYLDMRKDDSVQ